MEAKAKITISLKEGVLDPQARATAQALKDLGFSGIKDVSCEKLFVLSIDSEAENEKDLKKQIQDMCKKLLVNEITENHTIRIVNE